MGYSWDIPSGKHTKSELENGPVEIVDLPSYKMVIFHSLLFVYRRVTIRIHIGNIWDKISYE